MVNRAHVNRSILISALVLSGLVAPIAAQPPAPPQSGGAMFVQNVGQFDEGVRFVLLSGGPALWLADDGLWLTVWEPSPVRHRDEPGPRAVGLPDKSERRRGVRLQFAFVGAEPDTRLEPFDPLETTVSYFLGSDPSGWRAEVPIWGGVRVVGLYRQVDLELQGEAGGWSWRLMPRYANMAALPAEVRLQVRGAEALLLDEASAAGDGVQELRLDTPVGQVTLPLPLVEGYRFQRSPENSGDQLILTPAGDRSGGHGSLGTSITADEAPDLVYSTFFGGQGWDEAYAIAVDSSGAATIAGQTNASEDVDFPTTPGAFDTTYNGNTDGFVARLNPEGNGLDFATFLGGSGGDVAYDIAVGSGDAAYVTGTTGSADFPTTPGSFDTSRSDNSNVFVLKLSASGSALEYSTYLGGSSGESAYGIAQRHGSAYVTGHTFSADFPTTEGAYDTTFGGIADGFVVRVNATGSDLTYATFIADCIGHDITVDAAGAAYVTGKAHLDFPATQGAFDMSHNGGGGDAFLAKLNVSGSQLEYGTFLGGDGTDEALGIAIDGAGAAYVTGYMRSSNFPLTEGAYDITGGGGIDGFVVKLSTEAQGSRRGLLYGTLFGGASSDWGNGIVVDGAGSAYVTGGTGSGDFPTTPGSYQTALGGFVDAVVLKLDPAGSQLAYATYLGGDNHDEAHAAALDAQAALYIAGVTGSEGFPTTEGAFDTAFLDDGAFVTKMDLGGAVVPTSTPSPTATPEPTSTPSPTLPVSVPVYMPLVVRS